MSRDFTLSIYEELLTTLQKTDYQFITFNQYMKGNFLPEKYIILRHDVDLLPENSLLTAKIENKLGIKAVYYFRAVPESWNESIIKEISILGHEIGYHYESLTTCNGDIDKAYLDFEQNLKKLRKLVDVSTICMHGSPRSPYDSKDIWKKYDYKKLDLIGEPYLDIDFSNMFYLTDTGRRWDGYKVSLRDKIPHFQEIWTKAGLSFHNTDDVIKSLNKLPKTIMITTHPQRWNDDFLPWVVELVLQNVKNIVKRLKVLLK